MSVFERLDARRVRKAPTVTLDTRYLLLVVAGIAAVGIGWASGMKAGYRYAKEDAAAVLQKGATNTAVELPSWREWADTNVSYEPPSDLTLIFDLTGREIPGSGGMTTADIWRGYHTHAKRSYFERKPVSHAATAHAAPAYDEIEVAAPDG